MNAFLIKNSDSEDVKENVLFFPSGNPRYGKSNKAHEYESSRCIEKIQEKF